MRDLNQYPVMNPDFTVKVVEELGTNHARLELSPLLNGYGHTLGNALRRVLLTSLPGNAITSIIFEGSDHQYATLDGLSDDLLTVTLNLKQLVIKSSNDEPGTLKLNVKGSKVVTGADIEASAGLEIVNKDLVITEIVDNKTLEINMTVETGVGYRLADEENITTVGEIAVDSMFSPVLTVSYKVEATRVGRQTDHDSLLIDIKTNGTLTPDEALRQAAEILAKQFSQAHNPLVVAKSEDTTNAIDPKEAKVMLLTVEELDLPTRIANALRRGGYKTVGDLLSSPKGVIAKVKNLGEKSVDIVDEVLQTKGVKLED
ncbi:MAG: DNA-directed RNA polymerase subunit alpha [Pseudomonadales bacterium]|jgi:DNA-directed RNA polymerase subunit alpha|nr:DNA-directed RNA polymerase subunit alpha [Pseudomonadales bacterium]